MKKYAFTFLVILGASSLVFAANKSVTPKTKADPGCIDYTGFYQGLNTQKQAVAVLIKQQGCEKVSISFVSSVVQVSGNDLSLTSDKPRVIVDLEHPDEVVEARAMMGWNPSAPNTLTFGNIVVISSLKVVKSKFKLDVTAPKNVRKTLPTITIALNGEEITEVQVDDDGTRYQTASLKDSFVLTRDTSHDLEFFGGPDTASNQSSSSQVLH